MAGIVITVLFAPFAGAPTQLGGWPLIAGVLAPTFFAIMLFAIPLDITMSFVFMADKAGAERKRFKTIILTEFVLMAVMLLAWSPMIIRLLRLD